VRVSWYTLDYFELHVRISNFRNINIERSNQPNKHFPVYLSRSCYAASAAAGPAMLQVLQQVLLCCKCCSSKQGCLSNASSRISSCSNSFTHCNGCNLSSHKGRTQSNNSSGHLVAYSSHDGSKQHANIVCMMQAQWQHRRACACMLPVERQPKQLSRAHRC
jgi:hypothetical protein